MGEPYLPKLLLPPSESLNYTGKGNYQKVSIEFKTLISYFSSLICIWRIEKESQIFLKAPIYDTN
jgi:hypothetical protein